MAEFGIPEAALGIGAIGVGSSDGRKKAENDPQNQQITMLMSAGCGSAMVTGMVGMLCFCAIAAFMMLKPKPKADQL